MKAITISQNCFCAENNVKAFEKDAKERSKKIDFEWHAYLKQEKKHNIALSLFTK